MREVNEIKKKLVAVRNQIVHSSQLPPNAGPRRSAQILMMSQLKLKQRELSDNLHSLKRTRVEEIRNYRAKVRRLNLSLPESQSEVFGLRSQVNCLNVELQLGFPRAVTPMVNITSRLDPCPPSFGTSVNRAPAPRLLSTGGRLALDRQNIFNEDFENWNGPEEPPLYLVVHMLVLVELHAVPLP